MGHYIETGFVVPKAGPLGEVSGAGLVCFEAGVKGVYGEVVSDYQLALTELGWDFVIVDSGEETQLYGVFEGRDVSLTILDDGRDVVVIFVKAKE